MMISPFTSDCNNIPVSTDRPSFPFWYGRIASLRAYASVNAVLIRSPDRLILDDNILESGSFRFMRVMMSTKWWLSLSPVSGQKQCERFRRTVCEQAHFVVLGGRHVGFQWPQGTQAWPGYPGR
eukprot:1335211-Rhodomonas_salina.1